MTIYIASVTLNGLAQIQGLTSNSRAFVWISLAEAAADFWITVLLSGGAAVYAFLTASKLGITRSNIMSWLPWFGIGSGCLMIGIVDGMDIRVSDLGLVLLAIPLSAGCTLIIFEAHQPRNWTVRLVAVGLLLVLLNPLVTKIERHIFSAPTNYIQKQSTEPLPLTQSATTELWLLTHAQEATEIAATMLFWIAALQTADDRGLSRRKRV